MRSALALALAIGCGGASAAEIKEARLAVYDCDRTVVEAAVRAELRRYGQVFQEPTEPYAMQTETRWYTKSGQAGVRVRRDDDFLRSQGLIPLADPENNDAIILAYRAKVLRAKDGWRVVTDYAAARWLRDRQLPEPLGPKNASRPRWIDQRVHGLHVAIHKRLRRCAIAPKPRAPVGPEVDPKIDEPTPGTPKPPEPAEPEEPEESEEPEELEPDPEVPLPPAEPLTPAPGDDSDQ